MGLYKTALFDAVDLVGEHLTANNAHTLRTLLDWVMYDETGLYDDETLDAAYKAAHKVMQTKLFEKEK